MGKARERERLAHVEDLGPISLVPKERVLRCIRGRPVGGCQRLSAKSNLSSEAYELTTPPHLRRNIIIEVSCVFRVSQLRFERSWIPMDVDPINTSKPGVSLFWDRVSLPHRIGP